VSALEVDARTRRDDPASVKRDLSLLWIGARLAVGVMPFALAILMWAGLCVLPVRIAWFPFERGYYGLPWLSLYEWFAYLFLAAFFAVGFALIAASASSSRRLSADYRRLAAADADVSVELAEAVARRELARTSLVMRNSPALADYAALLDAREPDVSSVPPASSPVAPHDAPVAYVWPLRRALLLLPAVAVLTFAAGRVLRAMPTSGLRPAVVSGIILATFAVLYGIELGIVGAVAWRAGVSPAESVGMHSVEQPVRWLMISLVAALGLRIVGLAYSGFMFSMGWRLPGYNADPTRFFPHDLLGSIVMMLVLAVGAPIAEETVFRGVVLPSLEVRFGRGWAVAITSVLFAAMHINLFAFAPILLVGWVLARMFMRGRSLWPSIACHSAFNGIGVLIVLLLRGIGVV